jgi:hypothetical protein
VDCAQSEDGSKKGASLVDRVVWTDRPRLDCLGET